MAKLRVFGEKAAGFGTVFFAPSPTHISEFLSDFTPLFSDIRRL
jgi:hypothetical protein